MFGVILGVLSAGAITCALLDIIKWRYLLDYNYIVGDRTILSLQKAVIIQVLIGALFGLAAWKWW